MKSIDNNHIRFRPTQERSFSLIRCTITKGLCRANVGLSFSLSTFAFTSKDTLENSHFFLPRLKGNLSTFHLPKSWTRVINQRK